MNDWIRLSTHMRAAGVCVGYVKDRDKWIRVADLKQLRRRRRSRRRVASKYDYLIKQFKNVR